MNPKYAGVGEWTPMQMLLMSALGGAGGFGTMRLLNDMMHKVSPPPIPQENNAVKLMMKDPLEEKRKQEQQPSQMETITSAAPKLASVEPANPVPEGTGSFLPTDKMLMAGIGLPTGFLGAKFLYDKYMQHQLQQKIDSHKQNYMNELQMIQQGNKVASETPCVDGFCQEISEQLDKIAGVLDSLFGQPAAPAAPAAMPHPMLSRLASQPAAQETMQNQYASDLWHSGSHIGNKLTGEIPGTAWDATKLVGLLGLGTTLGGLVYANKQKRNKEMKAKYPTKVMYA